MKFTYIFDELPKMLNTWCWVEMFKPLEASIIQPAIFEDDFFGQGAGFTVPFYRLSFLEKNAFNYG